MDRNATAVRVGIPQGPSGSHRVMSRPTKPGTGTHKPKPTAGKNDTSPSVDRNNNNHPDKSGKRAVVIIKGRKKTDPKRDALKPVDQKLNVQDSTTEPRLPPPRGSVKLGNKTEKDTKLNTFTLSAPGNTSSAVSSPPGSFVEKRDPYQEGIKVRKSALVLDLRACGDVRSTRVLFPREFQFTEPALSRNIP